MTPDELFRLTGTIVTIGFFALIHQMYWQVRIGLIDRQAKSAFLFLLMTTIIIGQLAVTYLFRISLGGSERGPVFFFLWLGALLWWSYCTLRHNANALRRKRKAERMFRDAEDRLRKPLE